jgi:hypothetical protein
VSVSASKNGGRKVGDGRVIQCVASGVFLAAREGAPLVLVLSRAGDHPMQPSSLKLEGVSPQRGAVSGLLRALRAAMREHNVFRGRIIRCTKAATRGRAASNFMPFRRSSATG